MISGRFLRRAGLIAIGGWLAIAAAQGQVVVFSNLTTPNPHGTLVVGSLKSGGPDTLAAMFIPTGNFNLLDAKVSVASTEADPSFNVWLASDAGGSPGTFIQQIGFGVTATSPNGSVVTANSIATTVTLAIGTRYWLVLTPATTQTLVVWNQQGASSTVPFAFNKSPTFNSGWQGPFLLDFQFQIDGTSIPTATPVPPSLILFFTGLASAGLYHLRRRKRNS